MGSETKPDGRRTRELNADIQMAAHAAKQQLYHMIGEVDPVKVQRVLIEVLPLLDSISRDAAVIEQIHALAARRGRYNKGDDE